MPLSVACFPRPHCQGSAWLAGPSSALPVSKLFAVIDKRNVIVAVVLDVVQVHCAKLPIASGSGGGGGIVGDTCLEESFSSNKRLEGTFLAELLRTIDLETIDLEPEVRNVGSAVRL
jgi:hypothetical protein